ncbi:hypothetical protein [Silvimonas amylolytica]|uniref:Uncharacterized protein n=1 Tax=Silvimonas amylolytica TaxID=449663 RepID=A0ABQ2PGZ1_9NEIS|nr:hypothetical protein [Silvimonas amylolytica]GGP24534.1 hypothetical protein GCM10010971_03530 [Silvimonas amylolytica]
MSDVVENLPWDQRIALDVALQTLSKDHEDFDFHLEGQSWLDGVAGQMARLTVQRRADGKTGRYTFDEGDTGWAHRFAVDFAH